MCAQARLRAVRRRLHLQMRHHCLETAALLGQPMLQRLDHLHLLAALLGRVLVRRVAVLQVAEEGGQRVAGLIAMRPRAKAMLIKRVAGRRDRAAAGARLLQDFQRSRCRAAGNSQQGRGEATGQARGQVRRGQQAQGSQLVPQRQGGGAQGRGRRLLLLLRDCCCC